MRVEHGLVVRFEPAAGVFARLFVRVNSVLANYVYKAAVEFKRSDVALTGFGGSTVPESYLADHFSKLFERHVLRFLLNTVVLPRVYQDLAHEDFLAVGDIELEDFSYVPSGPADFTFKLTVVQPKGLAKWREAKFSYPKRKNYHDIDNQVGAFLSEFFSDDALALQTSGHQIEVGDWVQFMVYPLCGSSCCAFFPASIFVVRLGSDEGDVDLRSIFLGHRAGDVVDTDSPYLSSIFSDALPVRHQFRIQINGFYRGNRIDRTLFKRHFDLDDDEAIFKKIIEVFSFRRDVPQCQEAVDKLFSAVISKLGAEIFVPEHSVLRREEELLETLRRSYDYHVYKVRRDFDSSLRKLAIRQLHEEMIADYVAAVDNVEPDDADVAAYLNLLNLARTRPLLHFKVPLLIGEGGEIPVPLQLVRRYCRREKALNKMFRIIRTRS